MEQLPERAEASAHRSGYLVVLTPEAAHRAFLSEEVRAGRQPGRLLDFWGQIHAGRASFRASRYAGWDRSPIGRALSDRERATWAGERQQLIGSGADPELVPRELGRSPSEMERIMLMRLGEGSHGCLGIPYCSDWIIPRLTIAREVRGAARDSLEYDIVRVTLLDGTANVEHFDERSDPDSRLLGYEAGLWSGPFSVISDTAVYPRWHPAPDDSLAELMSYTRLLNEDVLFATEADARSFLTWYEGQGWAESGGDDGFVVARMEAIE